MSLHLIIDGGFAYRAFKSSDAPLWGYFLSTVARLGDELEPDRITVCWDVPGSRDMRRGCLSTYKSKRPAKPEKYSQQVADLKSFLPMIGIHQASSREGEADDVIATIARGSTDDVIIYTADKDLMQLVGFGVSVLRANKTEVMHTIDNIVELTGLTPAGWLNLQALAGDSTDGIPGVARIGDKRARELLKACPNIVDLVLAGHFDAVRETVAANDVYMLKWAELVIAGKKDLDITFDLVRLWNLKNITYTTPDLNEQAASLWLDAHELSNLTGVLI